jgi:quaternary ammonium compound-resistance protein SugE
MVSIMSWVFLILAGLLEVVWAFAMKQSHGFTRLTPTLVMIGAMIGLFGLLALAMRSLPLGTAYMIWTGIGAVGAFVAGVWFIGEALTVQRAIAAILIVAGMVTMKLS